MRLIDELNDLHAVYVDAVNTAVGSDDLAQADRLAEEYDVAAIQLVAERESRTHLLPLHRATHRAAPTTTLQRLASRLGMQRAA